MNNKTMTKIDFGLLTKDEVSSLIGHERGLAARKLFDLDQLDRSGDVVVLAAPKSLEALTPSFVQGLFASSVHSLGEQRFRSHYNFEGLSDDLREDINVGIRRALMKREIAGAA